VQPRLEGSGLIALLTALVCVLPGMTETDRVAAGALGLGALATLLRILRWRPWRCIRRPDLMVLVLGHAWLGCGLILFAWTLATDQALGARIHALTIGALGTLTLAVMARTRLLLLHRDANAAPVVHLGALLVSAAALARMAPLLPEPALTPLPWLLASALLWSAAFLILFAVLVRPGPGGPEAGVAGADIRGADRRSPMAWSRGNADRPATGGDAAVSPGPGH